MPASRARLRITLLPPATLSRLSGCAELLLRPREVTATGLALEVTERGASHTRTPGLSPQPSALSTCDGTETPARELAGQLGAESDV